MRIGTLQTVHGRQDHRSDGECQHQQDGRDSFHKARTPRPELDRSEMTVREIHDTDKIKPIKRAFRQQDGP
jgi:hypothetical protein